MSEEPSIFEKAAFIIKSKGDTGAYGEYLTKYMFGSVRLNGYHKELCNVYIPYKNSTSEVDIILIHEKGIFVIESKNYSGWIFGSEKQKNWTQMLNKNSKQTFYNPILQNKTHIKALSEYLNLEKKLMNSFIVFSERCELKKVPENTENFTIIKRDKLIDVINKITKQKEVIFSRDEIEDIFNKLHPLTKVSDEEKQKHIENIKKL